MLGNADLDKFTLNNKRLCKHLHLKNKQITGWWVRMRGNAGHDKFTLTTNDYAKINKSRDGG